MRLLLLIFLLFIPISAISAELYLPFKYPGSLGYFTLDKGVKRAKVVVGYKGKRFEFPAENGAKKAYFVIPYGFNRVVSLTLYENGKRQCLKLVRIKAKKYPVSRIWVKEKKLTPKLIERIRKEQKLLKKVLSQVTPKKFKSNKFLLPIKRISISTPFGAKRILNGKKRYIHWGVDLRARRGTPVRASLSGKVVLARELYYTGKTVIIDHGCGIHTLYAHLSKLLVKEGEFVKRGKVIGRVGSTGRSTGPHLHFGVYVNGVRADPMLVLKTRL